MNTSLHYRVANLSEWHRIKSKYHRGKKVRAIVVRILGHALLCRVGDYKGPPAIIRRHELSWNKAEQQTSGYREGDSFEAVVVEYGEQHRELVLSKKQAAARLDDTFPVGEEYSGTIIDLPSWGFTIHLEGGVDGFLLREEAPDQRKLPSAVRLQVGDRVRVEVIGYDDQQGNPRVSMNRAIARHQETIRHEIENLASQSCAQVVDEKEESTRGDAEAVKPMNILVLDDTDSVVHGVAALLQSAGHRVISAKTSQELATSLANCPLLDAALLDIQLDFESIRSADLPISIRKQFPGCLVYLYTGNESVLDAEDLRNLKDYVQGVIPKAWSPQQILLALRCSARSVSIDELGRTLAQQSTARSIPHQQDSMESLMKRVLERHFGSLEAMWKGSRLLVAEYDLPTTRLHVLQATGFSRSILGGLGKGFLDSELGDVLKDLKPLSLSGSQRPPPTIRELFRDLGADHVVAAPVRVAGYPRHVAVFCFGPPNTSQIPERFPRDLEHALAEMALEVQNEILQSRIFTFQKAAGAGALVLGMTHELRNLMSPVRTEIEAIRRCMKDPSRLDRLPAGFLEASVDRVSNAAAAMQSVMEGFLRMTKLDEEAEFPLIDILQEVVDLCRDSARQHDVYLRLDQNGDEAVAMKLPASVRQVFMNVILNGAQHVALTDVKHKLVSIAVRPIDKEGRLRIDITDNGYGVAANQRESMFEMFVTTRPNGTGLGLFVAKEILSLVGGEIRMKTNCTRYRDNTFSIFLPVSLSSTP